MLLTYLIWFYNTNSGKILVKKIKILSMSNVSRLYRHEKYILLVNS